jgi:hypothetical protein
MATQEEPQAKHKKIKDNRPGMTTSKGRQIIGAMTGFNPLKKTSAKKGS